MQQIISVLMLIILVSWANGQNSKVHTSTNLSISVSSDDDDYSYSAKFDDGKTKNVKEVITNTLGNPTEETDRTAVWEGKGYIVTVRPGKVMMEMDFGKVTKSFQLKFEDMGDHISEVLGSPKAPAPPAPPKAPKPPKAPTK